MSENYPNVKPNNMIFEREGIKDKEFPQGPETIVKQKLGRLWAFEKNENQKVNCYFFILTCVDGSWQNTQPDHVCTKAFHSEQEGMAKEKDGYFVFLPVPRVYVSAKINFEALRAWNDILFGPDSIYRTTVLDHATIIRAKDTGNPLVDGLVLGLVIHKSNYGKVDYFALTNLMINSRWVSEKYQRNGLFVKFLKKGFPAHLAFCMAAVSRNRNQFSISCPAESYVGQDGHMGISDYTHDGASAFDRWFWQIPIPHRRSGRYTNGIGGDEKATSDYLNTDSPTLTEPTLPDEFRKFWYIWKDKFKTYSSLVYKRTFFGLSYMDNSGTKNLDKSFEDFLAEYRIYRKKFFSKHQEREG